MEFPCEVNLSNPEMGWQERSGAVIWNKNLIILWWIQKNPLK